MKKYGICFLLLLVTGIACFAAGFWIKDSRVEYETAIPNTVFETETVTENQAVANQERVEPIAKEEKYYLVSEAGHLLVFHDDQSTICLYTHIPITDFPEKEQERLREGIWFSTMIEVYNYLESYTS